ncbi:polyhydroxyalkanoate synthesis repressor PhaR [Pyruvatibacter sp. HU-CL02332]|uniref:polyhydroxyalkanoate synthesis repressor PhaR n=1 Tax=Pyruvatibacter sp. HU-CL02332 TaxID=3127650 RepID=UPI00296817A5|nr:polyhydroxyalkanoate synthesis repressor PhaR [Alphaproteobacteria bacterium]
MAKKRSSGNEPITIKKYANRRLYNTATSSYVTLDHLADMVKQNQDFVVIDAKTSDDITRSVLTQIIFEEEAKGGQNLLPIRFMRQLIKYYGDSLQGVVPGFLEMSLENFAKEQERVRSRIASAVGEDRVTAIEEQVRENVAALESAVRSLNPFASATEEEKPAAPAKDDAAPEQNVAEMQKQMAAMQKQLDELAGSKKK